MTKVGIVVLNYNGEKYIGKCLKSLQSLKTAGLEVEIWVVDNASSDDSISYLHTEFDKFKIVQNPENLGYAEGNNVGIRHAQAWGADWVWIVNPDVIVDRLALVSLVEFAKSHPKSGVLGSKVYFEKGYEFHKARYKKAEVGKVIWYAGGKMDWQNVYATHVGVDEVDRGQFDDPAQTEFVTGSSMLLKVAMLEKIGLIDPKYFLYYEENDLCQRAKHQGWELWYVPASVTWHANAQSTGVGSPLVDYYTTRNRMLYGFRWAPLRSQLALIKESLRLLVAGRPWQKQGVVDFYLLRMNKGSYR